MTEKVKTMIECYFLLPDFKSRGHPSPGNLGEKRVVLVRGFLTFEVNFQLGHFYSLINSA